ncbi:nitronate monooxygenase [Streptomyces xinghaiensis]|uniref:nitronate monooxygenase n=1 Tax=Streptomyces xinghaiensis TaxID=1038928 RepID=UPI00067FDA00|nr:nitronate monooxygenase [Streptomyces xinghaiensis]MZE76644.1 nitronate monooxygenase [Streptomyces sp. SID5475]
MAAATGSVPAVTDLFRYPIVQAPMAGGASRPELAAAVCRAGGLGFLAAGLKTPEAMYQEIRVARGLTDRPFGVNLFLPQRPVADAAAVAVYREQLAGESSWYAAPLGDTDTGGGEDDGDDGYEGKLAVLTETPVAMVSFTFGCPDAGVLRALARAGTVTVVTVTSVAEARTAEAAGAAAVCVQGVEAGGHRGTHRDDPYADRGSPGLGLLTLLAQVREAVDLPLIAAGGLMRGAQIAAVLTAGAVAAQLGTAFLVCPESGADPLHKRALTDPLFPHTELTRAFTGRPARGLVNRFLREHGPYAPAAYPQVHRMTAGLRRAAARAGDPQGMALWAGQGHRMARTLSAERLVRTLAAELDEARAALLAGPGGTAAAAAGTANAAGPPAASPQKGEPA